MADYEKIADMGARVTVAAKSQGRRNKPNKSDHDRIVGACQKICKELGFRMLKKEGLNAT